MIKLPYILFWLLGIIWGTNFIYMKLASYLITPSQIVLLRVAFGFIPLLCYALVSKQLKFSHMRHIGHLMMMALIATVAYYYGFAKGTSLLLSGVAGALSALTPVFSIIFALLFLAEEKVSTNKMIGIGLGFTGVVLIANPFNGDISSTNIEGVLYNMMGSLAVGASFVYAKKFILPLRIPVVALITYQLALSLIFLLLVTEIAEIESILQDTHAALGLFLGLGILGTGLAYIIYYHIIEKLGAVSASAVTYIPPIIALAIGTLIVGENVKLLDYFATALILAGVYLVSKKQTT